MRREILDNVLSGTKAGFKSTHNLVFIQKAERSTMNRQRSRSIVENVLSGMKAGFKSILNSQHLEKEKLKGGLMLKKSFLMKKLFRRILLASLVGTMALGVTAAQAGTIKVGITFNMVSETGEKMGQMVLDEFEKQNELGGINGHQLEPILLKSDCKTD